VDTGVLEKVKPIWQADDKDTSQVIEKFQTGMNLNPVISTNIRKWEYLFDPFSYIGRCQVLAEEVVSKFCRMQE
jgi:hypothetical protein